MFYKLACLLFICLNRISCGHSHSVTDNSNRLMESERISTSYHRTSRGIVLVDEDLDIPPDKEHRWNADADWVTENSLLTSTEEGSGLGRISEFSSTTSPNTSPENLQMTTDENMEVLEGSGEGLTSKSTLSGTSTKNPKDIMVSCFNSTCDSNDLTILPGISEMVPEGANLTLSCVLVNSSAKGILKWYRHVHNGTDEPLVEVSTEAHHLTLNLGQSRLPHSGLYLCLRFTENSCCYRQTYVTVYQVPSYRHHLIVIGVVAGISMFICVLLVVCRNHKTRKYEQQMELQNMEKQLML